MSLEMISLAYISVVTLFIVCQYMSRCDIKFCSFLYYCLQKLKLFKEEVIYVSTFFPLMIVYTCSAFFIYERDDYVNMYAER